MQERESRSINASDTSVTRSTQLEFAIKCREITGRSNGLSERERIRRQQTVITGWVNYFIISKARNVMEGLDRKIRTRLRMCQWKAWKCPETRTKELIKLGFNYDWAYKCGNSSKGYCRVANSKTLLEITYEQSLCEKRVRWILHHISFEKGSTVIIILTNRRMPNGTYGGVRDSEGNNLSLPTRL